jgi:ribosomal protein S18 acetylase RimI-like enzyme
LRCGSCSSDFGISKGTHLTTHASLRLLQTNDLTGAMELSRLAGWNQTRDDWEMLLRLEPQGCFAIEADDQIVAITTLLCYGTRLAWIGMVLTRPEYRRRGFAQQLMEHALARGDDLKIDSIMLDATPQGQPLYEKLGFKTEQIVERWFRDGQHPHVSAQAPPSSAAYARETDLVAFGADRSLLIQELASRNPPNTGPKTHCFSRSGCRARYLGPCVAQEQRSARLVIEQTLQESTESGWFWDLLGANENAVQLAGEFGFAPQRRLERMIFGKRLPKEDELVYAIAGFELG